MAAQKPKVAAHLSVVQLDGEAVIYDTKSRQLHHLNQPATIVFSLCDGTATIRETSEEIAGEFGLPVDEVERQVRATVREFRRAGLLQTAPPRTSTAARKPKAR